jgi:iron complex outermembrane receptor protein
MMFRKKWVNGGLGLLLAGLFITPPVLGQEKKSVQLDAITVTADKREENIQEVPAAISAFTEIDLEDAGITSVQDVISMVPNMTLSTMEGVKKVNFRGIGYSMFTGKNPVVIYVDGIPVDQGAFYDADLNNVERVEVLRGPQGTLYGKNAIGGIINVISKKPGNTVQGKIMTEFAENDTYGIKGFVNGPIVKDKLFFGLSGAHRETRGFLKNDHPGQDYFDDEEAFKAKTLLRWLPSDRLEINLHGGMNRTRNGGRAYISSKEIRDHEYRDPGDKFESTTFSSALDISYATNGANFKSISTFSDAEVQLVNDWRGKHPSSNKAIGDNDYTTFTQEFRIQSPDKESRIKWLGGLYYSMDNGKSHDNSVTYNSKDWPGFGYFLKDNWPSDTEERTMSAFGQVTLPVTSRLDFTAGLRYERIDKELDYRHKMSNPDTGAEVPVNPFSNTPLPMAYTEEGDWDALLPKGVLSLTLNSNAMVYMGASQGYLAGGLNAFNDDRDNIKFDEQTSLNYEIGTKTSWFDNKLICNATLYYIDIKDMHVWNSPSAGIYIASNAAEAHSRGIELEVKARPVNGLDITAALGINDAEFDDYTNMYGTDCSGKTPQNSPEHTFHLAVQYRHNTGLFARADMLSYGKTYYDDINSVSQDAHEIYNAKIGYEGSNWDLYLYCKNLFDKEYFEYMYEAIGQYTVAEPRTVGITASLRF